MRYGSFPSRVLLISAALLGIGSSARAQFLTGKQLQVEVDFQGTPVGGLTQTFTVTTGPNTPEVTNYAPSDLQIDVNDTGPTSATITITDGAAAAFGASPNLVVFKTVSSGIPAFTQAVLDPATTAPYNDPSRLSFTGNSVSYDFGSLNASAGNQLVIDVRATPEPTTIGLSGIGLLASMFRRRG